MDLPRLDDLPVGYTVYDCIFVTRSPFTVWLRSFFPPVRYHSHVSPRLVTLLHTFYSPRSRYRFDLVPFVRYDSHVPTRLFHRFISFHSPFPLDLDLTPLHLHGYFTMPAPLVHVLPHVPHTTHLPRSSLDYRLHGSVPGLDYHRLDFTFLGLGFGFLGYLCLTYSAMPHASGLPHTAISLFFTDSHLTGFCHLL